MNDFYVYQYFDPIRNEPIYIGKGQGNRLTDHFKPWLLKKNCPFYNRIKWIQKNGQEPIISKLKENLPEEKAFKLEKKYIQNIGRKDLKKGPLLNLTDGGQGIFGHKHSKKSKQKMSLSQSGKNHPSFGKHLSKEHKEKISDALTGTKNPFYGKHHTPKSKRKLSVLRTGKEYKSIKWVLTFPNKQIKIIKNLRKFCRKFGLNAGNMYQRKSGSKGFKAEKYENF